MVCSPLGSSIHRILQARILGWVAISFSSGSSQPGDWTWVSCFVGRFFINWATTGSIRELNRWKNEVTVCCAKLLQSCRTVCNPMTYSPPGSSVHGILQAIVLEWIAISFSSGSSWPRDWTQVSHIVDRRFTIWATREVGEPNHLHGEPLFRDKFSAHSLSTDVESVGGHTFHEHGITVGWQYVFLPWWCMKQWCIF